MTDTQNLLNKLGHDEVLDVLVEVTERDIERGEALDCWKCPIAQALMRIFPDYEPEVDTCEVTLYAPGIVPAFDAAMIAKGADFIEAVDEGNKPGPVSFVLRFSRV